MSVNQITFKRGGTEYTSSIGIQDGKSTLKVVKEEVDERSQQKFRDFPKKIIIDFDDYDECDGGVIKFETIWKHGLVAVSGKVLVSTSTEEHMYTKESDIGFFLGTLGMPILMSMLNGYIKGVLGFDDKPLFNTGAPFVKNGTTVPTGGIIPYTPEEEAAPATFQYNVVPVTAE